MMAHRIITTDEVAIHLKRYCGKGAEHKARVEDTLEALRTGGPLASVLVVKGARRPLWIVKLDNETSLFFTIGMGPAGVREVHPSFTTHPRSTNTPWAH